MSITRAYFTTLLAALLCVLPAPQVKAARSFTTASSQYLELSSAVVSAEPLTMVCWAKPNNTSAGHALMSIGTSGGTARWQLSHNVSSAQCQVISVNSGGAVGVATAGTPGAGSWQHYAAVYTSSTSRTAYLDGVAGTTDTSSITVSGVNRTIIGARISGGSYGTYHDGTIAEAAIWNVALTASEISSLAAGFSPRYIRPASLVFYAPLVGTLQELRGGVSLTNVNSTTTADHPRVFQ